MNFELPLKPGDYAYYLAGAKDPVIEKGRVIGFDFRDGHTRIVLDFGCMQLGVLTELLGVRLFLNEQDAQEELKKWRQ